MARANGIAAGEVWEMDASRQTTRISANVSGMLGTERITLNDNLLRRTSRGGVLAVMGHEITNSIIRSNEYEADMFGLNAAKEPEGFAEAALLLGEYRKLHSGRIEEMLFFDHPSGYTRIHAAMC